MSLAPGTRLGPYEIVEPLGAGGMGEVLRARDTRLDRTVAIKVLPAEVSASAERRERLEREARAISRLSDPHICALYDVGEQDGVFFLVMEHLEGPTLAERLRDGALPIEQALRCGAEIAQALAAAHREGIVHRDLKPANVILTRAGAKVLDFGLARLREDGSAAEDHTDSLTLTREGSLVGTLPYMSPEQVEGRPADARSDIWALGTVLYEMATGTRAFAGGSRTGVMTAILTSEPAMVDGQGLSFRPAFDWTIKRCLAKDPDERWQSAADVTAQLRFTLEGGYQPETLVAAGRRRSRLALAALVIATAVIGLVAGLLFTDRREGTRGAVRLSIVPPGDAEYQRMREPAISPDGRLVAFVGEAGGASIPLGRIPRVRRGRLYVRDLETTGARPLAGTEGAGMPFWSPDGKWLGFFADGKLKRVTLAGGRPEVLCEASFPNGGTWSTGDVILFAPRGVGSPLMRIPASGGTPVAATALGPREQGHLLPAFLSDGQHFVFLADATVPRDHKLVLGRLGSTETTLLTQGVMSNVVYARPGHLFFVRDRALVVHEIDTRAGRLRGQPAVLAESLIEGSFNDHRYEFSVSDAGVLAYRAAGMDVQLAWFDRSGRPLGTVGPRRAVRGVRLSPDQTRVAFSTVSAEGRDEDLWVLDIARGTLARLTSHPNGDAHALWSPDGRRLVYRSLQTGFGDLYLKPADEMDGERPLVLGGLPKFPTGWSRDGRYVFFDQDHGGRTDVFVLGLAGGGSPRPFVATPFDEWHATLSPDGRWLAYASDESGSPEVYVRAFAQPERKWQVSSDGGDRPSWRADGRELFYRSAAGQIMAVPVASGDSFETGPQEALFLPAGDYDVAADGRRFLVAVPTVDPSTAPITVLLDWRRVLTR